MLTHLPADRTEKPSSAPLVLAITPEDREALLAALEIGCAIAEGQMVGRFGSSAGSPGSAESGAPTHTR